MTAYLPPGWPTGVHPPGSEGFERTAVAWLLDMVPPYYRLHGVLQRHPVALATLARQARRARRSPARQNPTEEGQFSCLQATRLRNV